MKAPKKIEHIGIAVQSLTQALHTFKQLGLTSTHIEEVKDMAVKVAFIPIGDTRFELLEPTSSESAIAKFIEKRGEGIHHICLKVEDIQSTLDCLRKEKFHVIYPEAKQGAENSLVNFIHPKSVHGILLELCQKK